jgi:hypothetical protein
MCSRAILAGMAHSRCSLNTAEFRRDGRRNAAVNTSTYALSVQLISSAVSSFFIHSGAFLNPFAFTLFSRVVFTPDAENRLGVL